MMMFQHQKRWKYMEKVAGEIIQEQCFSFVLLIGANCSTALEPLEDIPSEQGSLYALKHSLDGAFLARLVKQLLTLH